MGGIPGKKSLIIAVDEIYVKMIGDKLDA